MHQRQIVRKGGVEMIHGNVLKRKSHKAQILELIKQNPHMEMNKIIGIFSSSTGLSHKTINVYIEELRAEGKIKGDE